MVSKRRLKGPESCEASDAAELPVMPPTTDDVIDLDTPAVERAGREAAATELAAQLGLLRAADGATTIIDLDGRTAVTALPLSDLDPKSRAAVRSPLAGKTVHIISLNYWPEQCGIAPYATQLSEHLTLLGSEVTAVTGMPHYPSWRLEPEYQGKLRTSENVNGVTLRRLRHFVPARQTALRRALYEATFFLQAGTQPVPRPDLVVTLVPSLGGGIAAALHARRRAVPLVVIVQDLVGAAAGQSGIKGGSRVAKLTGRLEMWLLRQADVVAVLNDAFRDQALAGGVRPDACVVLPNWSHSPDPQGVREQVRARMGWPASSTVALHAGNMGLKQDLGNVIAAARLAEARGDDVLFVLMGDGSQRAHLEALAAGLPTLRFHDSLPDKQDYADVLGAADVLLVNEKATVVDMSLPSKLTSYFRSGRPVVAAVVDAGTTAAQVRQSGGGLVVPPARPEELLGAVALLGNDPDLASSLASAGREFALRALDKTVALRRFEQLFTHLLLPPNLPQRASEREVRQVRVNLLPEAQVGAS